jgi:anti-sigma B factor antagonist
MMAGSQFDVQLQAGPGRTRVTVAGDVDMFTAPAMARALTDARDRRGATLLDLGRVSLLASHGIEVVLASLRAALAASHPFAIAPTMSPAAARALALTGLLDDIPVGPAEPGAPPRGM